MINLGVFAWVIWIIMSVLLVYMWIERHIQRHVKLRIMIINTFISKYLYSKPWLDTYSKK